MSTANRRGARSEPEAMRAWYEYLSRGRKRYLEALRALPEAELRQDRGASFPTVADIFTHILDAHRWWFEFVARRRVGEYFDLDRNGPLPLVELTAEEARVDALLLDFVGRLDDAALEERYPLPSSDGVERAITARDLVWHMLEEELQHRGELNAILWQQGSEPPISAWDDDP